MTLTITLDEKYLEQDEPAVMRLPGMTPDEFFEFCQRNPELNVELSAKGDVLLMPPADLFGESLNAEIVVELGIWNRTLAEPGMVVTSSGGITLPNGAVRAPDAAWIRASRWKALSAEEQKGFARISPDLVVELLSPTDRLPAAQGKMREWLENGVSLGLLIDRKSRKVFVYRAGEAEPQEWNDPAEVSCEPELPGFVLPMQHILL